MELPRESVVTKRSADEILFWKEYVLDLCGKFKSVTEQNRVR